MRTADAEPDPLALPQRRPRGSLRSADIVRAAIDLIERDGLAALTMPELAREMGARVTSIYWHFRSKDDLLRAVAERVTETLFTELTPARPGRSWDEEFLDFFTRFRLALLRSHAFLELFASRAQELFARDDLIGRILTEHLETEVAAVAATGLDATDALRVYNACSTYVRGFVTLEVSLQREGGEDEAAARVRRRQQDLDPQRFPVMSQIPNLVETMRYGDEQFAFGLRLLLDGIRVHVEQSRRAAPRRHRTGRDSHT